VRWGGGKKGEMQEADGMKKESAGMMEKKQP
jgi:hypothetical protein